MYPEAVVINRLLSEVKGKRVVVLGDAMLDRYEVVKVVKLSQEAPVLVVKKLEERDVLGGAANVALNVRSLGGEAHLIGVVGMDEEGEILRNLLEKNSIDHDLFVEGGRPTTLKTRFTDRNQQFFRLDREITEPLEETTANRVISAFGRALDSCDCVAFSDYAKGFFTPSLKEKLAEVLQGTKTPLVVDPKPANQYLCEGCYLLIPNRKEGALIAGVAGSREITTSEISRLLAGRFSTNVLVTEGKEGMTLCLANGEVIHVDSKAREVYDVSGAGDTVAATMALAVAARCDLKEAVILANSAAGVAVSKAGTATVTPDEIMESITGTSKIKDLDHLVEIVNALKGQGKKVVFTNGCFDLLHVGHIKYLKAARSLGDVLIVGINTDASVRRIKGNGRPLISEMQRAELIAALESVDYVVMFSEDTPHNLISILKPQIYVKGGDYSVETLPETPLVKSYGGEVVTTPVFDEGVSTTRLLERISRSFSTDE